MTSSGQRDVIRSTWRRWTPLGHLPIGSQ